MNLRTWNLGGMIFLVSISAILISGCGGSSDEEKVQRAIGKAETFYKAGLFKEALAHYQEALAIQPTDAAILLAMGQTYEALSLNRDALGSYDEAIRFDSRLEQAYRQKALLLIKDGKIEEVDKLIAGIEAKKEMEGLVPFLKGEVARSRNDWSGALEFYQAADRLRPGSRETQYALAEAYQRTGKPEDAINLLEQMLRTNPRFTRTVGRPARPSRFLLRPHRPALNWLPCGQRLRIFCSLPTGMKKPPKKSRRPSSWIRMMRWGCMCADGCR